MSLDEMLLQFVPLEESFKVLYKEPGSNVKHSGYCICME